jgi:hypothetical protein
VRPGGMLVQKRRSPEEDAAAVEYILVRVSTGWQWHDVSIDATATFGTSSSTSPAPHCRAACSPLLSYTPCSRAIKLVNGC